MEASTSVRQSIIEHYKGDDVFQRSEEFYQQLLNSRKPNQPISQSAYQSSYQQSSVVQKNSTYNTTYVSPPTFNTQYNSNTLNVPQNISPAYQTIGPAPTFILPQPPGPISPPNNVMQPIPEMSLANSSFSQGGIETSAAIKGNSNQHISPEVQAAIEENNALNVELERLTKGDADFGNSDSVIKMSYYSLTQAETKQIQ